MKKSKNWVVKKCLICDIGFESYDRPCSVKAGKQKRTCSLSCANALNSQSLSGEKNPAFGKTYRTKETHPEWAESVSKTSRERQINSGDKNGMRRPENREKARASANRKWLERPELRKNLQEKVAKKWADGEYDGVRVGQCEWHHLRLKDGREIKLQGTWELAYAKWMDDHGMPFEAHVGRIPYVDDAKVSRSYYPDFRLVDGTFVDVKNPYYEKLHARKLELVCEQNVVVIRVVNKQEMERLGLL